MFEAGARRQFLILAMAPATFRIDDRVKGRTSKVLGLRGTVKELSQKGSRWQYTVLWDNGRTVKCSTNAIVRENEETSQEVAETSGKKRRRTSEKISEASNNVDVDDNNSCDEDFSSGGESDDDDDDDDEVR